MSRVSVSPYINFQGRTREAMEFYQDALGGKLDLMSMNPETGTLGEAGPDSPIMHAQLQTEDITIMATDGSPDYPPTVGDNFALSLYGSDEEQLRQMFDKLSADGTVKQPLKTEVWGDTFGYFADKFGINWMVDITRVDG